MIVELQNDIPLEREALCSRAFNIMADIEDKIRRRLGHSSYVNRGAWRAPREKRSTELGAELRAYLRRVILNPFNTFEPGERFDESIREFLDGYTTIDLEPHRVPATPQRRPAFVREEDVAALEESDYARAVAQQKWESPLDYQ